LILVVDTEKTALECIKYMREQRCGTATFLPLDTIESKPIGEKYRAFVKGARLVFDAVQFEPSCERALLYAVGNALIADTMDIARYICYEKRQEVKVVTLDGTIIHKTGNITGGYSDNANARRWEEKEMAALQAQKTSLAAQLGDIQKQKRKVDHDDGLISQLTHLETKHNEIQDDIESINQQLASNSREILHYNELISDLESQILAEEQPLNELNDLIESLESCVHKHQNKIFNEFCVEIGVADIREYEQGKLSGIMQNSKKRTEYITNRAKIANQLVYEQEQLNETIKRVDKIDAKIEDMNKFINLSAKEQAQTEEEFDKFQDEMTQINELLDVSKLKLSDQGKILS
jgi:structural maintenance of chromosome 1